MALFGSLLHVWLVAVVLKVVGTSRPHIIIIVADDLGWNDVSFHGSNQIPTPHIDKLAYGGIILNNYYVSPICTPTRGALLSGKHPIHTGLQSHVIVGSEPYGLPLNITIMPQWLKELGYRTHMIGKWHLGFFKKEYTPTYRGFETHLGFYEGCGDYYDHTYEASEDAYGYDFRRNGLLDYTAIGQYSTELFTNEANKIIRNHNKSEPLFLYLPYQAVHSGNLPDGNPLQAPKKYVKRFHHIKNKKRKMYGGMVSALDDAVGSLVENLKNKGLYDNSIILFTTDNGGAANGYDGNAANNFPLRGCKETLWEGGLRGVGFIHSPLLKTKCYVAEQMIHVCDWLPTLYKAAGGDPNRMTHLDGYDLWNMLSKNEKEIRNELLHNIDPSYPKAAIRVGDFKLLYGKISMKWGDWYPPWQNENCSEHLNVGSRGYTVSTKYENTTMGISRNNAYKGKTGHPIVIECGHKPTNASTNCQPDVKPCLYNISIDPCEYHNIAEVFPEIVNKLMDRIHWYNLTMVPPGNKPQDPAGNPKYHNGAWGPWIE